MKCYKVQELGSEVNVIVLLVDDMNDQGTI